MNKSLIFGKVIVAYFAPDLGASACSLHEPARNDMVNRSMSFIRQNASPEIYDDEWWIDLPPEIQSAFGTLGWDETSWNDAINPPSEYLDWDDLTPDMQGAATVIGYTQEMWDKEDDDSNAWIGLPLYLQEAATILGYNETLWNNNGKAYSDDLFWDELTMDAQEAAMTFGYDELSWDGKVEVLDEVTTEEPTLTLVPTPAAFATDVQAITPLMSKEPIESMFITNAPSLASLETEEPILAQFETNKPTPTLLLSDKPTSAPFDSEEPTSAQFSTNEPTQALGPTESPFVMGELTLPPIEIVAPSMALSETDEPAPGPFTLDKLTPTPFANDELIQVPGEPVEMTISTDDERTNDDTANTISTGESDEFKDENVEPFLDAQDYEGHNSSDNESDHVPDKSYDVRQFSLNDFK